MTHDILHLASFEGNIGDIANHTAMHEVFQKNSKDSLIFSEIEMRFFYRNSMKRTFNSLFLEDINKYSAFILGGGNFFDIRWNESHSGSTLDMSKEFMRKIEVPVIINSMGFMNYYPEEKYKEASEHFYAFLNEAVSLNWRITVRNDGSKKRILKSYGKEFEKYIETVPDAAFLFKSNLPKIQTGSTKKVIGINFINELFDLKYTEGYDIEAFNKDCISFINGLIQDEFRIVLFPHTPQDLKTIEFLTTNLDEKFFRYSIQIAPFTPNSLQGVQDVDRWYSMCDIVIEMRFHACVLAIKNCIPVISLSANERISDFFEELGIPENCINLKKNCFSAIREQVDFAINNKNIKQKLTEINKKIYVDYNKFAKSCLKQLGIIL